MPPQSFQATSFDKAPLAKAIVASQTSLQCIPRQNFKNSKMRNMGFKLANLNTHLKRESLTLDP